MSDPVVEFFDAMRDAGVERLRFRRTPEGSIRIVAALRDGAWEEERARLPGAESASAWVTERMLRGGHERLDLVFREEVGLRFLCAVHSTHLGPGAGGLRRTDLVVPEIEVIGGLLNLARAMTYKNAAAGSGRGGSKLGVHNPGIPEYERSAWIECLAEEIELSGTITGPDTGYPADVYRDLAERSDAVTGVTGGGTAEAAAHGVYLAVRATAAALGISLAEATLAVQGLGSLGLDLARRLVADGARLTVTDRDHRRIDALLAGLEADRRSRVSVVAPYQILDVGCDVLVPCATGGVVSQETLPRLRARALCGGANNQLEASCLEDEISLARALQARSILFVPDWLASAGGAIHGIAEWRAGPDFDPRQARARIRRLCGWGVDEILERAKRTGTPPLEVAIERFLLPEIASRERVPPPR
jgi:glutamate dehydrogenase/leucine dehydrogenase